MRKIEMLLTSDVFLHGPVVRNLAMRKYNSKKNNIDLAFTITL